MYAVHMGVQSSNHVGVTFIVSIEDRTLLQKVFLKIRR